MMPLSLDHDRELLTVFHDAVRAASSNMDS